MLKLRTNIGQTIFGVGGGPLVAPTKPQGGTGAAHRPVTLQELVGQETVRNYLAWKAISYKKTLAPGDHCLFLGPSGCGKTTLSQAYANALGTTMHKIMCPQVSNFNQMIRVFAAAKDGDVVFLDEIQELSKRNQQMLYELMEDGRVTMFATNGIAEVHEFKKFIIIAATTHEGRLLPALLNRFGYKPRLDPYTPDELANLVNSQALRMFNWELPDPVGAGIGMLSQGVPRNAMNLLRALFELAIAQPGATKENLPVDSDTVYSLVRKVILFQNLCPLLGLPTSYRKVLVALEEADGAPMGLPTLASKVNEDDSTVKDAIEPFLLSQVSFEWGDEQYCGPLISRTSRGRLVTKVGEVYLAACRHLKTRGYLRNETL